MKKQCLIGVIAAGTLLMTATAYAIEFQGGILGNLQERCRCRRAAEVEVAPEPVAAPCCGESVAAEVVVEEAAVEEAVVEETVVGEVSGEVVEAEVVEAEVVEAEVVEGEVVVESDAPCCGEVLESPITEGATWDETPVVVDEGARHSRLRRRHQHRHHRLRR